MPPGRIKCGKSRPQVRHTAGAGQATQPAAASMTVKLPDVTPWQPKQKTEGDAGIQGDDLVARANIWWIIKGHVRRALGTSRAVRPCAGGKLVFQYTRKKPAFRKCGATGVRLNGVRSLPGGCTPGYQMEPHKPVEPNYPTSSAWSWPFVSSLAEVSS